MRTIISSVSSEDLVNYFKGGTWKSSIIDGIFRAKSNEFKVKISPKGAIYDVRVTSNDDPQDSDEDNTDDPVGFIVEFLGTGTPGDTFFKKRMSAGPDDIRNILLHISNGIDNGLVGPKRLAKILRRVVFVASVESVHQMLSTALKIAISHDDFEIRELADLRSKMAEKGWKAKVDSDNRGLPVLTVDIGGIYEAVVSVSHQSWDYQFEDRHSDHAEDGVTDDPIFAFQSFQKTVPSPESVLKTISN